MMKKLLYTALGLALLTTIFSPLAAKADGPLDEIEQYNITVDMENDGSADITYHIDWKVLDDTSEGPLSWVKIGIPNEYADNITAISDNIRDIYYYSDGGDYVRIDLDREYHAGELVSFDFSIHEPYMFILDSEQKLCRYEFTPGWFDEIDVKSMTIKWNNKNVINSNAPEKEGDYLLWTASPSAGERYTISVMYNMDVFDTDYSGPPVKEEPPAASFDETTYYESYNDSGSSESWVAILFMIVFAVIIIVLRILRGGGGGGGYYGGFGGHGHIGGGGHCACASSCACACGCACACACAGGGRAGCSAKNLYGAVPTHKLKRALQVGSQETKP